MTQPLVSTNRACPETEVDDTERRFRSFADAIPHIVWTARPDGSVDYVNRRIEKYTELGFAQVEGWNWMSTIHPDDVQTEVAHWERAIASGTEYEIEMRIWRASDCTYRWHLERASPLKDANGNIVKWVGTVTDIDDRKQALAAAERANRAKSDFLSSMSHELRSPLNAILGFAQLMATDSPPPTPSQQASIDQILRAGWHLLELINDVLDLAKIDAGQVAISPESVSLDDVLRECDSMIVTQAGQRGIRMTFPQGEAPCHVRADRTRVKQVLVNLLSNAVKYNCPSGAVDVTCSAPVPGRVRVSVSDTGPGLSPEQVGRLFQPFNRLGQEAGPEEGTGIGLVVAKRLMELMGGGIGVDSTPGKGSVFWIELDSAPAPEMAATRATQPGTPASGGTGNDAAGAFVHTVLYIEDNPANLKLVEQLIARRADLRMLGAPTGRLGVELARSVQPRVIVMDINLPDISGIEALGLLRKYPETADIPVVALSSNAMPHDVEEGLAAGFFRYLIKPIKIAPFMRALVEAIALATARK
ncbi:PAS domain-containing hybrid sensor histidine kinase/response regulator [Burkholderia lata]|uniref:histidine kinase n=1 Tax=Burkholderia lata (strain ATCC 17760 / DSM 23089 / LMG 22485 / NCIMB 9086 / R18194 / 383) TaxID=482957 RepID=Q394B2_BURL3|nr:ATP-binding protein [Burkholderia lata]ABB12204.1 PAS/PAC sensor hybrid histidine kinase [Burkholderia lata]